MSDRDGPPTYIVTLLPSYETLSVTGRAEIVSGELRIYVWNSEDLLLAGFRDGGWDHVVTAP